MEWLDGWNLLSEQDNCRVIEYIGVPAGPEKFQGVAYGGDGAVLHTQGSSSHSQRKSWAHFIETCLDGHSG